MKIVFLGTPDYVVPILESLHKKLKTKEGSPIIAVVTQPPKPAGRKKYLQYSSVDSWAYEKNIEVIHNLEEVPKADLGILAAYGELIPKSVIKNFSKGILNVHPSLLPKWRGASPVQASIISGEKQTGVSVIKLTKELDKGPIVSSFREEIKNNDTTETLRNRLFKRSAEFLIELIPNYMSDKIQTKTQKNENATYTTIVKKEHGFIPPEYLKNALNGKSLKKKWKIDFVQNLEIVPTPTNIHNFIRAMQPWPICWTLIQINKGEKRLKILKAHVEEGKLVIDEIQLEGKNPASWKQFKQGYPTAIFL